MDETLRAFVAAQVADRLLCFRLLREIVLPNPGAGQEVATTVPGGVIWELVSFGVTLTTSAVVGARAATLRIRDADNNHVWRGENSSTQAASLTVPYSFCSGLGAAVAGSGVSMPLATPASILQPGWKIGTVTAALDAADTYLVPVLYVREWSAGQIAQHMEKVLADTFALRIADREI